MELRIAWSEIMGEYADAIGDNENKIYLSTFKAVNKLSITLQQTQLLINMLQKVYYAPFAEKLNRILRTNFKFNPENKEEYQKLLKSCTNRSKAIVIELDLKLLAFKAIEEKNQGKGEKYTREYFQSILITISDYAKYQIGEDITVYEFCERLNRFNAYCTMMEKQYKK